MGLRPPSPLAGVAVSALLLVNLVACGGHHSSSSSSPSSGGSLKTVAVLGKVVLPGGTALPAGAKVGTLFGDAPVAADGSFTATVADALPSLVTVVDASGAPLEIGMFGKDRPTIDATSEALAIVLVRVGAGVLPEDLLRPLVLEGGSTEAVRGLAQALDAKAAANPRLPALTAACASEIETAAQSFGATSKATGRGIQIDPPDAKSGITVLQRNADSFFIRNEKRRRAIAWVDEVSYKQQDGDGTVEIESRVPGSSVIDVSPTNGLTSVIGGLVDAFSGNYAYTPTETADTTLRVTPDRENVVSSKFRVVVAGPGNNGGATDALDGPRTEQLDDLKLYSFFADYAGPAIGNLLLGGLGLRYSSDAQKSAVISAAATLVSEINDADLRQAIKDGDLQKALTRLIYILANDGNVLNDYFTFIGKVVVALGSKVDPKVLAGRVASAGNVLLAANVFVAGSDLLATANDWLGSNQVETFDVTINRAKLVLRPTISETNDKSEVFLSVNAPGLGEKETNVRYDWFVSGTTGTLRNGDQKGTQIQSAPGDAVFFVPTAGSFGDATVTVQETLTNAGGTTVDLGKATAKVQVRDVSVVVLPARTSVKPGGTATISAKILNEQFPTAGLFKFSVAGGHGTISNAGQLVSGQQVYTAGSSEGKDVVTVEAYRLDTQSRSPIKIGEAKGEIRVEEEPSIIYGKLGFFQEAYADGTTPYHAISAYVGFSPPADAKYLVLHGYGGNDTAYYGTSIERTLYPPFSTTSVIGTPIPNATGLAGGGGAGSGDIDTSYYQSRFGAFTWEIEVYR